MKHILTLFLTLISAVCAGAEMTYYKGIDNTGNTCGIATGSEIYYSSFTGEKVEILTVNTSYYHASTDEFLIYQEYKDTGIMGEDNKNVVYFEGSSLADLKIIGFDRLVKKYYPPDYNTIVSTLYSCKITGKTTFNEYFAIKWPDGLPQYPSHEDDPPNMTPSISNIQIISANAGAVTEASLQDSPAAHKIGAVKAAFIKGSL